MGGDAGGAVTDWRNAARSALAKECLRIEKAGGSVREFLREAGFISPWGTWWRLQKEELGRTDVQIRDGKGGNGMRKITLEAKKQAVEIAIGGGNPLPYLKQCGSRNPEALWGMIKRDLKKADPEKYAQIPARIGGRKKEEENMEQETRQEEELAARPVNCGEFNVTAVRDNELGRFEWDEKDLVMYWRSNAGDELCLAPEEWRKLAESLPKVMEIFGI